VAVNRRRFLTTVCLSAAAAQLGCAPGLRSGGGPRRLRRIGIQLYSLRDDARRDLERTIAGIASIGYDEVELLGSMSNFGMPAARLRELLDRNGLRAPSTHVNGAAFDALDRTLDEAATLGHRYVILAGLPTPTPALDDYRRWADRLNEAGRVSRDRGIWVGFHNHATDHAPIRGTVPYDLLIERTDPAVTRHQLDTGNAAMAGRDPIEYQQRYASRYWLYHVKDVPRLGASSDTELGKGTIDFARLFASIDGIDEKHLYVEQETYPGAPVDSLRRDYEYVSKLEWSPAVR
jgi:sugar phosphate isomerase/epimerase